MRPLSGSLTRAIDGSVLVTAVGHRALAPVLAATLRSNLQVGRSADVACHRGLAPPVCDRG